MTNTDYSDLSPHFDPSRSTVYMANLPYDLKPDDIESIFEKHGKIVKVTLLRVKETRKSKGVAFVLFEDPRDAKHCVDHTNNTVMFGQVIRASMAKDNGRRPAVVKRPTKSDILSSDEIIINRLKKKLFAQHPKINSASAAEN